MGYPGHSNIRWEFQQSGGVAQMGERVSCKHKVAGSRPATSTNNSPEPTREEVDAMVKEWLERIDEHDKTWEAYVASEIEEFLDVMES